ncbi:MAG: M61 family metallopeptidase, partial [Runella sp.]
MHYRLSASSAQSYFIDVQCHIEGITSDTIELQLPSWRPGRYELQNFAKNIQQFSVFDATRSPLPFRKITKDRWLVQTNHCSEIWVEYNYYANLQNAGSSYTDEELLYVNPVNLCIYAEGKQHEPCTLELIIPHDFQVACGLKQGAVELKENRKHFCLEAKDYYELIDSPLMASAVLQCQTYEVAGTQFYVWIHGNIKPDWQQILADFKKFTTAQIAMVGSFPEDKYHFLNLILPTPYYHGVEHRHSTMIVLGPDDEGEGLYTDLLGVSSHELFHAWNVIRIRPKELLPYDLTCENYFPTCFVVEGVTTYYGDLFLRRSGVFDDTAYHRELQTYMKRHFESSRYASQSLVESSWDLWLDGYERGIPQRKVSVYQKGALVALILDLTIRKLHNHQRSLDDVIRLLWQRFGIPFVGYTLEDYQAIVEEVAEVSLDWYWQDCIFGNTSLESHLNTALSWVGLQMVMFSDGSVQLQALDNEKALLQHKKWLEGSIFL